MRAARTLTPMRTRHCVQVFAVAAFLVSCGSGEPKADAPGACSVAEGDRAIGLAGEPSPPEDLLQWAGFDDITGLEVLGADEECGLDASARIALRGPADAVDAALAAAGLVEPPAEGFATFQSALDVVDLDSLSNVVSFAEQPWENDAGELLVRQYVRGQTGVPDQEVLHIWAFTT